MDAMRQKFEECFATHDLTRRASGEYQGPHLQTAWCLWECAWRSAMRYASNLKEQK